MLFVPLEELPSSCGEYQVVELVYSDQVFQIARHLSQDRSLILQSPKHLFTYLNRILRKSLQSHGLEVVLVVGRNQDAGALQGTRVQRIVRQLEDAVSSYQPEVVFILPYIDILTSARQGITAEGREIFTLIHENPRIKLLAFEDPEYPVPEIVAQAFFTRIHFTGTPRKRLHQVITRAEARRFGTTVLPVMELHRLLGGQSPVQIRRILTYIAEQPEVNDSDPRQLEQNLRIVRELTLSGEHSVSPVDLDTDIAGYSEVKRIIREEILALLEMSRTAEEEDHVTAIEGLIPKGMILHGPPGTGKTLFAQGIANAIQGTVFIVHGPELKSQFVGEGEANIRRLFAQAREHAPAVVVFDELDSIAGKRDSAGVGTESSRTMVNQLLTEMDGFRPEELVFVVGTTNAPDLLDSALLRPGRFQLKIEVPYPDQQERQDILQLWNDKYSLGLDEQTIVQMARWTSRTTREDTPFAGDHLRSLCQGLKRWALREQVPAPDWADVQRWLRRTYLSDRPVRTEPVTFEDIAGYREIKNRLKREVLDVLRARTGEDDMETVALWDDVLPKGIVLEGPPGTGKTLLARALAGEWHATVEFISAPEVFSKWVGDSEERIRALFRRARSNAPTVVLIDEIDALAQDRSTNVGHSSGRSILLQLMTELSEMKPRDRVLVVATTNTVSDIDQALLRPGRLGTPWNIGYPDADDIGELIRFYSERFSIPVTAPNFEVLESAFLAPSGLGIPHTPDDIRSLFQHLKRHLLQEGDAVLDSAEALSAWLASRSGMPVYGPDLLRRVAIHEAGHAMVLILSDRIDTIEELRLHAGSGSLGYLKHCGNDAPYWTESDLYREIAVSLGGRGAELIVFGEGSTGCAQDLEHATDLARQMVGRFGMGPEPIPQGVFDGGRIDPYYLASLQPQVGGILTAQADQVASLLEQHRGALERLADLLLLEKRVSREKILSWWNNGSVHG
jgi:cell division protease FtsH